MTHNAWMRRLPPIVLTLTALIAGLLVGKVGATTPAYAAPDRVVGGWMPYWMTSPSRSVGIDSAVANADLFEDVSPFWYSAIARKGGGVQVALNPSFTNGSANVAWAMELRPRGWWSSPLADASRGANGCHAGRPGARGQHVADLVALVVNNGYDGLDLDYENFAFVDSSKTWDSTLPNWTTFVAELGAALHAQGKCCPRQCRDRATREIVAVVDTDTGSTTFRGLLRTWIDRIMAYDYTVRSIGPIAPIDWVRANVEHAVTVMDPAKLQIGVPATGGRGRGKPRRQYRLSGGVRARTVRRQKGARIDRQRPLRSRPPRFLHYSSATA